MMAVVVARLEASLEQVSNRITAGPDPADEHERLPDPEPVREHADQDHRDDVNPQVPVAEAIARPRSRRSGSRAESDGRVVEARRGDRDRRDHDIGLEELAERVLQRRLDVDALGLCLDQRPVPSSPSAGPAAAATARAGEIGAITNQPDVSADPVLVGVRTRGSWTTAGTVRLPTTETIRLEHWPARPEAHHRTRPTCGEKSDQRGSRHQADALDHADHEALDREHPLRSRLAAQRPLPVNSSPKTTRFARPSRSVSPANSEPKAPIRFPNARVRTKNVIICRFTRGVDVDTGTDIQLVGAHSGEHRDSQVHNAWPGVRVGVQAGGAIAMTLRSDPFVCSHTHATSPSGATHPVAQGSEVKISALCVQEVDTVSRNSEKAHRSRSYESGSSPACASSALKVLIRISLAPSGLSSRSVRSVSSTTRG